MLKSRQLRQHGGWGAAADERRGAACGAVVFGKCAKRAACGGGGDSNVRLRAHREAEPMMSFAAFRPSDLHFAESGGVKKWWYIYRRREEL